MTDLNTTQVSVEAFTTLGTAVPLQVTQVALEHWVSASASVPEHMLVTQVSLEEWFQIPPPILYQARAMVLA